MSRLLPCVAVLVLAASEASAGFIVGPGNVSAGAGDQAFDIIAVDLNAPVLLAPGTYVASFFNRQFTDFAGFQTKGNITPLLLTGGGTSFTPIAIGITETYAVPTPFISVPFGGSNVFTLSAPTTIFGGVYWETEDTGGPELRMPVGYADGGSSFVLHGGGFGPGANPPVIGTPISGVAGGSNQAVFSRMYDFSIQVDTVSAVPEPSAITSAVIGIVMLAGWSWLRSRKLPVPSLNPE